MVDLMLIYEALGDVGGQETMLLFRLLLKLDPAIEKSQNCKEIGGFHPSRVDQWVRVFVSFKQRLEKGTCSSQDRRVCFHQLTILNGQGNIRKVIFLSQVPKSFYHILLEIVPLEAKFFRHFVKHKINLQDDYR